MKASIRDYKKTGKFLELIATTETEVAYFEEITGESIPLFKNTGEILAIICIPFEIFKNLKE